MDFDFTRLPPQDRYRLLTTAILSLAASQGRAATVPGLAGRSARTGGKVRPLSGAGQPTPEAA